MKVNIIYKEKPKVHYTDIVDLEHFRKSTVPALLKAIKEVETIKFMKSGA